jgi:hypothetical protein
MSSSLQGRFLIEVLVVSVGLGGLFAIVWEGLRRALPDLSPTAQVYSSVVLAGGLFHIVCEVSGVNRWYLDNGVAALTRRSSR